MEHSSLPPAALPQPDQDPLPDERVVVAATFHQGLPDRFHPLTQAAVGKQCCAMASTFLARYYSANYNFAEITTPVMDDILTTGHKVFTVFRKGNLMARRLINLINITEINNMA